MAIFLLGQTKTAQRIDLADGSVLLLSGARQGNFQDVLTSGTSSLRDQGWEKIKRTPDSAQLSEAIVDVKSHFSNVSAREYLKNSELYKTLLDALKQVTLGRPNRTFYSIITSHRI